MDLVGGYGSDSENDAEIAESIIGVQKPTAAPVVANISFNAKSLQKMTDEPQKIDKKKKKFSMSILPLHIQLALNGDESHLDSDEEDPTRSSNKLQILNVKGNAKPRSLLALLPQPKKGQDPPSVSLR